MAVATQESSVPSWLPEPLKPIARLPEQLDAWAKRQHPAVEVALATMGGGSQGAFLGGIMGAVAQADPQASTPDPSKPPNPLNQGGPVVMARNFAVITGVQAGLNLALKKWRGKEDVQTAYVAAFAVKQVLCRMLSSLGAGLAFSAVAGLAPPGANPITSALATGMSFAVMSGAFYKVSEFFGKKKDPAVQAAEDLQYSRGKALLRTLGLTSYEKNIKQGLLTDSTILLWNNSALQEVRIPPGPRLLILDHIDTYRDVLKDVLKPAVPVPAPAAYPPPQPHMPLPPPPAFGQDHPYVPHEQYLS